MSTENPENSSPELKTSSAEEIKKRFESLHKNKKVKLSNGLVVEVSQPDMFAMVQEGLIPSDLIDFAINMDSKYDGKNLKDTKDIPLLFRFIKTIILNSVVNPKIVDKDPKDVEKDEVPYSYLESNDRIMIFNAVASGGEPLKKFRSEEPKPDENAGQSVQQIPEQKTE